MSNSGKLVGNELLQPTVSAAKDDSSLPMPAIVERAAHYVYRLLAGARAVFEPENKKYRLYSGGNEFLLSEKAYEFYTQIRDRVQREELSLRGIAPPFDAEAVIRIFWMAEKFAKTDGRLPPEKLRVFFLRMDNGGCGFYRVVQPVRALANSQHIIAEEADWISVPLGQAYDVIVAPRASHPSTIGALRNLQDSGKTIIYESDDLMSAIPEWNPFRKNIPKDAENFRRYIIDRADGLIVSTPELREHLGRADVTHVCMNGINPELWPMQVQPQDDKVVRILWAGSNTHEKDLALVTKPLRRALNKFGKRVEMVFVNYAPPDFMCAYNDHGSVRTGIAPDLAKQVKLVEGCPVYEWSEHLAKQECHLAIAPLCQHKFNECKSELKVLEAWALGIPVIASKIAPYARAIEHGANGLLCSDDPEYWYDALSTLITKPEMRTALAEGGLKTLNERYIMPEIMKSYERALMTIALPKAIRPECAAAMQKALNA